MSYIKTLEVSLAQTEAEPTYYIRYSHSCLVTVYSCQKHALNEFCFLFYYKQYMSTVKTSYTDWKYVIACNGLNMCCKTSHLQKCH
jgi:hypothetical protein